LNIIKNIPQGIVCVVGSAIVVVVAAVPNGIDCVGGGDVVIVVVVAGVVVGRVRSVDVFWGHGHK